MSPKNRLFLSIAIAIRSPLILLCDVLNQQVSQPVAQEVRQGPTAEQRAGYRQTAAVCL